MQSLIDEYEKRETTESRLVKELDVIDLLLVGAVYEEQIYRETGQVPQIEEFFTNSKSEFEFDEIREVYELLTARRNAFLISIGARSSDGIPTQNGEQEKFSEQNPLPSNGFKATVPQKPTK